MCVRRATISVEAEVGRFEPCDLCLRRKEKVKGGEYPSGPQPHPHFFSTFSLCICDENSQKRQQRCGRGGRGVSGGNSAPPSTFCDSFAFFGRFCVSCEIAAGQGLEPQYHPPEGCVLPLDEPAIFISSNIKYLKNGDCSSKLEIYFYCGLGLSQGEVLPPLLFKLDGLGKVVALLISVVGSKSSVSKEFLNIATSPQIDKITKSPITP